VTTWACGKAARVTLRRDHVAGGAFVIAGAVVYVLSGDLPFGSVAMPGAGMLPKLVIALLIAFAAVLLLRAGDSPPFAEIRWGDLPHAARVVVAAAAAIALYERAGFLLTMAGMLFALTFFVERKPFLPAALFSVGVTASAYVLFNTLLKSPLPRGLIGF
jgi:Tripartite tricarboxylate transporter TctB family